MSGLVRQERPRLETRFSGGSGKACTIQYKDTKVPAYGSLGHLQVCPTVLLSVNGIRAIILVALASPDYVICKW